MAHINDTTSGFARELTLDELDFVSGGGGVHLPPGAVAHGALTNKMLENPNGPAAPILL